ncbi:asparaginase [Methylotuvimicrobium buryatense]|uniref:Asparaginase n=1 Tax=Methylotuvimicrobium buryatense TaxID=95641 RepID=A0A4P9USK3_METBY|nr:asparaginase domain-containing protein [Methylotuvimicrobium buryatense]QCW84504.1 asparaginase [Methylotuvimicrobium buryatense]
MKNVLLVFTGGTIGSEASCGTIATSVNAPYRLLQLFERQYPEHSQIDFTTIRPVQILSENITPTFWETLIKTIEAEQPERYDGVIVTHGTDTLAYTAAALSLYFHALNKPMLLVSSDRPLDHPEANGLNNFIAAIEFIRQRRETGVFVPYRNPGEYTQIHLGSRLASSLQLSGDFISVQNKSYCRFENGVFSEPLITLKNKAGTAFDLKPDFSKRIALIRPYPGLNYTLFNLDGIDAVLHDLYHSGTACASMQWGADWSLLPFIERCSKQGIPVYLAPSIHTDSAYESTRELLEQGAEMLWNLSLECAYVKLLLAYGNFSDSNISRFIKLEIASEHL